MGARLGGGAFGPRVIAPATLRPFHRWWMAIGEVLGWFNTRVVLGIVY